MEHFQKYLYGQKFHVCINHSTLTCLSGVVNLEGQTVCWVHLQEHRQGQKHTNGDVLLHTNTNALSWRPCSAACTLCQEVECKAVWRQSYHCCHCRWFRACCILRKQLDDDMVPILQEGLRKCPKKMHIAECSPICSSYWAHRNFITITDNMLGGHWGSADGWSKTVQIVLPSTKLKEIVGSSMEVLQEGIWL